MLTLNPFIIATLDSVRSLVYGLVSLYIAFSKMRVLLLIISKFEVPASIDSLVVRLKLLGTSLLILLTR